MEINSLHALTLALDLLNADHKQEIRVNKTALMEIQNAIFCNYPVIFNYESKEVPKNDNEILLSIDTYELTFKSR